MRKDVSLQGIASADADFGIKGEANMDLQILLDKRNNKLPMQFTFNGLDVKIWIKLNAKTTIEEELDENGSPIPKKQVEPTGLPDYVKNLIAPGKPVKFDIL